MISENNSSIQVCPISLEKIDKHLVKLYSSFVLLIFLISLFIPYKIGVYLITIDFIIRVFIGIKYSPLCTILTKSLKIVAIKPFLIDSGRKKIAAQTGLFFSVLISISYFINFNTISIILTGVFSIAIILDLVFDYCIACKMQSLYITFFKKK